MVFYISQLARDRAQKFGYGINAIFPIVAVLWGNNSEKQRRNSERFRCFFARRIRRDPGFLPNTTPRSLIIRGKNSEKQRKQRNRGVQSSRSAPKTTVRGAVSRAAQNAA